MLYTKVYYIPTAHNPTITIILRTYTDELMPSWLADEDAILSLQSSLRGPKSDKKPFKRTVVLR